MKYIFLVLLAVSANSRVTDVKNPNEAVSNFIPKIDKRVQITIDVNTVKEQANKEVEATQHTNITESCANRTGSEEISNHIDDTNETCTPKIKVDNGTALILTPYVEEGRIAEGRNASKVDPSLFLGLESYSGFLTVNKTYNTNLFFWYFPVLDKPVNETPWIIWLQGGPGASSLTGLFDEIGPFKFYNGSLLWNRYTWLRNHSLVFIDNPVGSGFSFTDHADGFVKDQKTYGLHLYTAVKQLVQLFPELRVAPLYIAGESYAGKYVPALGIEIFQHNDVPGFDINMQGLIIGNAYVDPAMISQLAQPFYNFGLLEQKQMDIVRPLVEAFQRDIAANNSIGAKNKWNSLVTVLLLLSNQKHAYNFLRDDLGVGKYIPMLYKSEVKRALHVGDIKFSFVNFTVNMELAPDFLSSTKPLFETLLDHYRVLTYCGQLDQMLPCVFTSENYRTWKWNGSNEFIEATRYPYLYNHKMSGYHKTGGGLTEVVIRGAGHMVPLDAPAPAQDVVARWTHRQPLGRNYALLQESFLRDFVRNSSVIHVL